MDATLTALSFFSSREMAESFHAETATGEQSLEAMADAIHSVVPAAVRPLAVVAGRRDDRAPTNDTICRRSSER